MLPFIAASICESVGFGVRASSAAADMICPAWQYPHSGTSSSFHVTCSGCVPVGESPSIVTIGAPAAADTGVWHARTARPRRCTVHAPHWPVPHPYFVPFKSSVSRNTHSSGMSGATSTETGLPLTLRSSFIGCRDHNAKRGGYVGPSLGWLRWTVGRWGGG